MGKRLAALALGVSLLAGCSTIPSVRLDEIVGFIPSQNGSQVIIPIVKDDKLVEFAVYRYKSDQNGNVYLDYVGYVTLDHKLHTTNYTMDLPSPDNSDSISALPEE